MKKLGLLDVLEGIDDTRRGNSVIYPLQEILFIMLVAVICGATSYVKVEMFGKSKENWFRKYLKLEYGIPDACTFRNVIKEIDTARLHEVFREWMRSVVTEVSGVIAIDGKQARRTKDNDHRPLHVVSAFSTEKRLVLGQLACEEKSNISSLFSVICPLVYRARLTDSPTSVLSPFPFMRIPCGSGRRSFLYHGRRPCPPKPPGCPPNCPGPIMPPPISGGVWPSNWSMSGGV